MNNLSIIIKVSKKDVKEGVRNNCVACPISRAAKRALPTFDVIVSGNLIKATSPKGFWNYYALPASAIKFVRDFDSGKDVIPLTFEAKAVFVET